MIFCKLKCSKKGQFLRKFLKSSITFLPHFCFKQFYWTISIEKLIPSDPLHYVVPALLVSQSYYPKHDSKWTKNDISMSISVMSWSPLEASWRYFNLYWIWPPMEMMKIPTRTKTPSRMAKNDKITRKFWKTWFNCETKFHARTIASTK